MRDGSSLRRPARTAPADPPPTITTSAAPYRSGLFTLISVSLSANEDHPSLALLTLRTDQSLVKDETVLAPPGYMDQSEGLRRSPAVSLRLEQPSVARSRRKDLSGVVVEGVNPCVVTCTWAALLPASRTTRYRTSNIRRVARTPHTTTSGRSTSSTIAVMSFSVRSCPSSRVRFMIRA